MPSLIEDSLSNNFLSIQQALTNVYRIISKTPVLDASHLYQKNKLHLKLENLNIGGSFKIRGASNAVQNLMKTQKISAIRAASAGNHAQAVAYICSKFSIPCEIYMPENTPLVKILGTKMLGGTTVIRGKTFDDATKAAKEKNEQEGGYFLHAFDNEEIIKGQASVGVELFEQVPDLDVVFIPIGGGGLASGSLLALKHLSPKTKVIGVQTAAFPSMQESRKKGRPTVVKRNSTIADGIAVKQPSALTFAIIEKYLDDMMVIDEEDTVAAIMSLMENNHTLAEGAGAISFAAFQKWHRGEHNLEGIKPNSNLKTSCIISGGNIDLNLLSRVTKRGQIFNNRLIRLRFQVEDAPGNLSKILRLISKINCNVLEVNHNRVLEADQFRRVIIDLDLEIMNEEHKNHLLSHLQDKKMTFQEIPAQGNLV